MTPSTIGAAASSYTSACVVSDPKHPPFIRKPRAGSLEKGRAYVHAPDGSNALKHDGTAPSPPPATPGVTNAPAPAPAPSPSSSEASLSDDPLSSAPPAFLGVLGGNRRPGGGLKKKVDYGNFGSTLVNTGVGEYDSDEFED